MSVIKANAGEYVNDFRIGIFLCTESFSIDHTYHAANFEESGNQWIQKFMKTILSTLGNSSGQGFNVMIGPGNIYLGGAVAFIPQQDCNMISVRLGLKGYTAQMMPHFALQLLGDSYGKPADAGLPHFTKAAPNDGSPGEFTFVLESKAALKGGQTYWVLAYGGTTAQPYTPVGSNWVAGSTPHGNAQYAKSCGYQMGNFMPSSEIPAFRIDVE